MEVFASERTLSELDHIRLSKLVLRQKGAGPHADRTAAIERILDESDVVPWHQMPADVVTMHSRVLVKDFATGQQSTLTLCYPADANPGDVFVSVLSPAGWNLLGRKVGSRVTWSTPRGDERTVEILGILFQPESSADFTT